MVRDLQDLFLENDDAIRVIKEGLEIRMFKLRVSVLSGRINAKPETAVEEGKGKPKPPSPTPKAPMHSTAGSLNGRRPVSFRNCFSPPSVICNRENSAGSCAAPTGFTS